MFNSETCRFWIVTIALMMFTGCTTMQPLPSNRPSDIKSRIVVGDKVEIVTSSGDQIKMKVEEKLPAGLRDGTKFVAYTDIADIKVRRVDGAKTETAARVVGGILLVGATLYALQGYGTAMALGGT